MMITSNFCIVASLVCFDGFFRLNVGQSIKSRRSHRSSPITGDPNDNAQPARNHIRASVRSRHTQA
jgi:hypothetical protein